MRSAPVQGSTFQLISYATRTLFNALINGNRGYQAPYPNMDKSVSTEAAVMIQGGGPHVLHDEPATLLAIQIVPQAHDMVHVAAQSRMLPAWSPESTSGGWVANPYSFDPPPDIPDIVLPQPQWAEALGETRIDGLTTQAGVFGQPMPGFGYPGIIGSMDNVTSTGTL